MRGLIRFLWNHPLIFSTVAACLVVLACGLVILASLLTWPDGVFRYAEPAAVTLPEDENLAGHAAFDQASYLPGALMQYRLRVLYRADSVTPDFDSLRRRMNFFPFEQRGFREERVQPGEDGVGEYLLEYELQGVRTEPDETYRFDPSILYYTLPDDPEQEVHSYLIQPPLVHVSAYYPDASSAIPLQAIKGQFTTATPLRRNLMAAGGLILLILLAFVLWRHGRRRRVEELAPEERLWREFHACKPAPGDTRATLLEYERIYTHLLEIRTGISPDAFWSGATPEEPFWRDATLTARQVLLENYQLSAPDKSEVDKMERLIRECLTLMVKEARLRVEEEPSYIERLKRQPRVQIQGGALALLAIILFVLAGIPGAWVSDELNRYNALVADYAGGEAGREQTYLALSALGDASYNDKVKAAALYNAGTLRAGQSFTTDFSATGREQRILDAVMQEESVEALFHSLLEGMFFTEETQIVTVLIDGAEQLRRAHLDLQGAVRIDPADQAIPRNLELVVKRHQAVLARLAEIRRYYRERKESEEEEAVSDEGIINLLEAELPEDDEEEESQGKDDRGYMILERF